VRSRTRALLAGLALSLLRRRHPPPLRPGERERIVPDAEPDPGGEVLAFWLFVVAAVAALGFVAVYALDRLPDQTQLLGATLGLSLVLIAAALIVVASRVIVTEELEEDYPAVEHPEEQQLIVQTVRDSGSRISRKGLFKLGAAAAAGSLGLALLAPLASLGPVFDIDGFYRTPWRRGKRLVDETGRPYHAAEIEQKAFYTAFPQGADRDDPAAAVVVVRLEPTELDLPQELKGYPAQGIVAFSKICTHAACAISLYRAPLFPADEPKPALVCPCHYSTFDPSTGGTVLYGPAGRKLPMLPLTIDRHGYIRATGTYDEPVGASWWGVRLRKPTSA
jgi:ubiquinol-cytochrome c reductase iron-sulfur subunit